MGVFNSSPTTIPGPWVAGPPMNIMIRAPVFGKVHYQEKVTHEKSLKGNIWIHISDSEFWHILSKQQESTHISRIIKCLKQNLNTRYIFLLKFYSNSHAFLILFFFPNFKIIYKPDPYKQGCSSRQEGVGKEEENRALYLFHKWIISYSKCF